MPPRELTPLELGDEPIYCSTHHDEVLYSGDDDDYYQAPEHRRMRIEAKAIQYLKGHTPFLLSARLRGPFDSKSWTNPWISKRPKRQPAARPALHSHTSALSVEHARGDDVAKSSDQIPSTQRTSLLPLPSPEITDPPSARQNMYLPEEEYSRIKAWRQTVKKIPLSKDPFWTSGPGESRSSTATKKRAGDQDWLHKRESKKHRSEDLRRLLQEESPSQAIAKTRGSPVPARLAEIVPRSALGSSTCEDELAAHWRPNTASFDTSRLPNIPTNTPGLLPNACKPSFAGLMFGPPAASLHRPSPSLAKHVLGHTSNQQKRKAARGTTFRDINDQENEAPVVLGVDSQMRASQKIQTRWDRTRRETPRGLATIDIELAKTTNRHEHVAAITRRPAKNPTKMVLGPSQQDESFCFHQARPKHLSPPRPPQAAEPMDQTTLSLPSSQSTTRAAVESLKHFAKNSRVMNDDGFAATSLDVRMDPDPAINKELPPNYDEDGRATRAEPLAVTEAVYTSTMAENQSQEEAGMPRQSQHERLVVATSAGPDRSNLTCTQELSPVSMQDKQQAMATTSGRLLEGSPPTMFPAVENADTSNPEWSTYVNTQDLSPETGQSSEHVETLQNDESMAEDADPNDLEWSTYINTQDKSDSAVESAEVSELMLENAADLDDPEWMTYVRTQDYSGSPVETDMVTGVTDGVQNIDQVPNDASNSEWSSYMSTCSNAGADDTGNTSNDAVPTATPARESQDTVGGIIDVYANNDQTCDEHEDSPNSQIPIEQPSGPGPTKHQESEDIPANKSPRGEDPTTLTAASPEGSVVLIGATEPTTDPVEKSEPKFDSTTMSLESQSLPVLEELIQSPWTKGTVDLPRPVILNRETMVNRNTIHLGVLASQALAVSPAPQTPWLGDKLPTPNFSLSVKRFSDFMELSPHKKRMSPSNSILRGSVTSRVLFGTPVPPKLERHVAFALLPEEEEAAVTAIASTGQESVKEEDLSYFDARGNKTAVLRVTRSRNRAASPPPSDIDIANAAELPDHDDKFAGHFMAMSRRVQDRPRKIQRLLPSDSQQMTGGQAVEAMAEAFIRASQAQRQIVSPVVSSAVENRPGAEALIQASQTSKQLSPMAREAIDEQSVDDVSAVLDNIDDFLDNSWGFDTSMDVDGRQEPRGQQTEADSRQLANLGDPMLALHTNVWAD